MLHSNVFTYRIEQIDNIMNNNKYDKVLDVQHCSPHYIKVKYVKDKLQENYQDKLGIYKNVLFNTQGDLISCFPPKNIDSDKFLLTYTNNFVGKELIHGIHFSLFWDKNLGISGSWEIHGYDDIGGHNKIINTDVTLKDYFLYCDKMLGLSTDRVELERKETSGSHKAGEHNKEINKNVTLKDLFTLFKNEHIDFLSTLPKSYIYHLVMPFHNRSNIQLQIYVMDIFTIENMNGVHYIKPIMEENYTNIQGLQQLIQTKVIQLPKSYSTKECRHKVASYDNTINISSKEKGICLKINNGCTCKVLNKSFTYLHILKSIQPQYQYLFLNLRIYKQTKWATCENKLLKEIFIKLEEFYKLFMQSVFISYSNVFIEKSKLLNEVHPVQQYIMNKLHRYYLHKLRPKEKCCTIKDVQYIFGGMKIEEQMYFLTYILRDSLL